MAEVPTTVKPPPDRNLTEDEFGFKQHYVIKVGETFCPDGRTSLVATNNRFGLIAVGFSDGIKIYKLERLLNDRDADVPELEVKTGSCVPVHVAFNCDGTLLSVFCRTSPLKLFIYDITNIQAQNPIIAEFPGAQIESLLDLAWNPVDPSFLSTVSSYSQCLFWKIDVSAGKAIHTPVTLQWPATCLSWSPKGKQLAVGTTIGVIVRVDQTGKVTFVIPPNQKPPLAVVGLYWHSTYSYLAAYAPSTSIGKPGEVQPVLMAIKHGKNVPIVFTDYSDIWCGGSESRVAGMCSAAIPEWDTVITMSYTSMDSAVMMLDNSTADWNVAGIEDTCRISVPMVAPDYQEHYPLGLAVCFNSTVPVPLNESLTVPPCPIVCMLSTDGSLLLYHAINRIPNAKLDIVQPPQHINVSSLKLSVPAAATQNSTRNVSTNQITPPPPPAYGSSNQPAASTSLSFSSSNNPPAFGNRAAPLGQTSTADGGLFGSLQAGQKPQQFAAFGVQSSGGVSISQPNVGFPRQGLQTSTAQSPAKVTGLSLDKQSTTEAEAAKAAQLEKQMYVQAMEQKKQLQLQQDREAEKQKELELQKAAEIELKKQKERLYQKEMVNEILIFQQGFDMLKRKIANPLPSIMTEDDKREMKTCLEDTTAFSTEIKEAVQGVNEEIHTLKLKLLDTLAYMEKTQSLHKNSHDPLYREQLKHRELDPQLSKLKLSIDKRYQHMREQLSATDQRLDEIWSSHNNKQRSRAMDNAVQSDVVYKTLSTVERIIALKQNEVDFLAKKFGLMKIRKAATSSAANKSTSRLFTAPSNPSRPQSQMNWEHVSQLKEFLLSREDVPIIKSKQIDLDKAKRRSEHIASKLKQMATKGRLPVKASPPAQGLTTGDAALSSTQTSSASFTTSKPSSGFTQPVNLSTQSGKLSLQASASPKASVPQSSAFTTVSPKAQASKAPSDPTTTFVSASHKNLSKTVSVVTTSMAQQVSDNRLLSSLLSSSSSTTPPPNIVLTKASNVPTAAVSSMSKPASDSSLFSFSKPALTAASSSAVYSKSFPTGASGEVTFGLFSSSYSAPAGAGDSEPKPAASASSGVAKALFSGSGMENAAAGIKLARSLFGPGKTTATSTAAISQPVSASSPFTALFDASTTAGSVFREKPASQSTAVTSATTSVTVTSSTVSIHSPTQTASAVLGRKLSLTMPGASAPVFSVGSDESAATSGFSNAMLEAAPVSEKTSSFNLAPPSAADSVKALFGGSVASPGILTSAPSLVSISTAASVLASSTTDSPAISTPAASSQSTATTATSVPTKVTPESAVNTMASSVFGGKLTASTSDGFGAPVTQITSTVASGPSLFGKSVGESVYGENPPAITPLGGSTTASSAPTASGAIATAKPAVTTGTATTSSSTSVFGAATSASASVVFGNTTPASSASGVFGNTTTASSASGVFGNTTPASSASGVFGNTTPASSASGVFGNTTTASSASGVFGNTTTTSSAPAIFGTKNAAISASPFAATSLGSTPSGTSNLVGAVFTPKDSSAFGVASPPKESSAFGAPTTAFGSTPGSVFGTVTSSSCVFGGAATTAAASTAGSLFGTSASTTSGGLFGSGPTSTATAFGSASTSDGLSGSRASTSVFGGKPAGQEALGNSASTSAASSSSVFGNTSQTSTAGQTLFGSGGGFGLGGKPDPEKAKQNPFGATAGGTAAASPQGASKNLFGNALSTPFGSTQPSSTSNGGGFGGFGTSTAGAGGEFGSSGASAFGNKAFGSPATSVFGSPNASAASPFAFGAKPTFGGTAKFGSPPAFGTSSGFGAPATFGSPSPFGGSSTQTGGGGGGFGQSPGFAAVAQQSTPTFGSLAGGQAAFGGAQQNTPTFGSPGGFGQTTSAFGGSAPKGNSFSSYRS